MSDLKLIQLDNNQRVAILKKLGYTIDEKGFITKNKKRVKCKYSDEPVHINNAAVLPGSVEVINANPITMAEYFLEHD